MVKRKVKDSALDFGTAFSYSFNRAKGLLNVLWLLLPIFGWFALGGYSIRITREFSAGKFKQLPLMKFGDDMELGFMMFVKAIPFVLTAFVLFGILYLVSPFLEGFVEFLFAVFVFPVLFIHFVNKGTVESFFEFKVVNAVFENFGDYIMTLLKSVGLAIIFFIMIIVLVGIPASLFTKNIFLADFYRRRVA